MLATEKITKGAMTPEEILTLKVLTDSQVSPDGAVVAFVVSDNFKEEGAARPHANIWISPSGTGEPRQFTSGIRTDYMPRWSPDGSRLVFLSDRVESGKFQIYLLPTLGGEAIQLTDIKGIGEIMQIEWSRSGEKIAFLMYDPETDEDRKRFEESGGAVEYEKRHKYARIYVMDVATKKIEWQSTGNYHVWEFSWSPDELSFAAVVADEPYEWSWHISSLGIIDWRSSSKPKMIYTPRPRQIAKVMWSQDGREIYFISAIWSDRGLVAGDLYSIRASEENPQTPTNLTNDSLGSVHYYNWYSKEEILIVSVSWARTKFTIYDTNSRKFSDLYEGDIGLADIFQPKFSISSTGSGNRAIAVVREDLDSPQEVWSGEIDPLKDRINWKQLTEFNHDLKQKYSLMKGDLIEWTSFDGLKIQGFLYLPSGVDKNFLEKRLPVIVNEHGGPSMGYGHRFATEARFYASHGYAVLLPNPRGSAGRGVKFLELNRGNIDGDDFKDIMAGVDYCEQRGWVDPQNEFVFGGSYGGYLVAWTVTHTNRFKAAVMDFGIPNLLSCHGAEWNTYWEVFGFDIDPYKQRDLFEKKSAIYYVENAKTPTLIIHGKDDPCVPLTQGNELFRALKELGVETEFVIYPREGHGWIERKHKLDAWRRHLEWFEKHKVPSQDPA